MQTTTITQLIPKATIAASGGVISSVVIFTDKSYLYFAIAGAIVSMLGVIHDVYGYHSSEYTRRESYIEIVKGFVLGLLAIPFWFLVLTEGIINKFIDIDIGNISGSLSLIVSFALSWFTVPIFNWMSNKVTSIIKVK